MFTLQADSITSKFCKKYSKKLWLLSWSLKVYVSLVEVFNLVKEKAQLSCLGNIPVLILSINGCNLVTGVEGLVEPAFLCFRLKLAVLHIQDRPLQTAFT